MSASSHRHTTFVVVDHATARLSAEVRDVLPSAFARPRPVSAPKRGHRNHPICQSCGWQHSTQVVGGACVDVAACAKREETWR